MRIKTTRPISNGITGDVPAGEERDVPPGLGRHLIDCGAAVRVPEAPAAPAPQGKPAPLARGAAKPSGASRPVRASRAKTRKSSKASGSSPSTTASN